MMDLFEHGWEMALLYIGGVALLIWIFWLFFRMSNPRGAKKNPALKEEKNELARLKDQYARGDITREEFEEKKKELE